MDHVLNDTVRQMDIKTGYFARAKEYEAQGYTVIGISRYPPDWLDVQSVRPLAPEAKLLMDYKAGKVSDAEYDRIYTENLQAHKGNVTHILNRLAETGLKHIVLCCYEKPGAFCHRHLLADFLNREYGLSVTELPVKQKTKPVPAAGQAETKESSGETLEER
jgi:uncharacterized protein YeaO (DUF488 family)